VTVRPAAIELRTGRSAAAVVPSRGAIVTQLRLNDRDLLYLDEATLVEPTKNVRGGIPVLFPSPGPLAGGRFERAGKSGAMPQHGFARNQAWTVDPPSGAPETSTSMRLDASAATRAAFPWDFAVAIRYELRADALRIEVHVENPSATESLPFALGFHPYFSVSDKARVTIATRATRAFDNVAKRVVPFRGFDLTGGEVDMHLLDHGSTESELARGDGTRLSLRASPEFTRWVVWSLPGRDFVCVEPWTAPADALNTGEGIIALGPGGSRDLWFEVQLLDV
jgi:galactose mutarotase-like enzyme